MAGFREVCVDIYVQVLIFIKLYFDANISLFGPASEPVIPSPPYSVP